MSYFRKQLKNKYLKTIWLCVTEHKYKFLISLCLLSPLNIISAKELSDRNTIDIPVASLQPGIFIPDFFSIDFDDFSFKLSYFSIKINLI